MLVAELTILDAQEQLRLITAVTFPHWSGDSKNPKEAARQGNRRRNKYINALKRAAGMGPGVDVLTTGEQLERWFQSHGLATV